MTHPSLGSLLIRLALPLIVLALLLAALVVPRGAAGASAGECNRETGLALINENPELDPFSPPYAVGEVLCGEFLGPGTQAMVVPIIPSTCGRYFGWAAFRRLADGSWQLAWKYGNGQENLVAVGTEIEETVNILGPEDPRCTSAEKSTKTRTWHWNGAKFVAGPWTVHLETGVSVFVAKGHRFGAVCQIGDEPDKPFHGASCKTGKVLRGRVLTQLGEVRPSGRVRTCRKFGMRACGGALCGCTEGILEVLAGERVTSGRFTCRVARDGVTCTAVDGQGFFINSGKVRRLP